MRVEMDVFDAADIGRVVDVDADLERTAEHVADVVQLIVMSAEVNALVGIDQRDIDDAAVHSPSLNGPGIRLHGRRVLIGIKDGDPLDRRALLKVQECRAVFLAGIARCQNHGSAFGVGMVGRLPFSREAYPGRDHQVVIDPVQPPGHVDDTAPVLRGGVERLLNCHGVIGSPIRFRAVVEDADIAIRKRRHRLEQDQKRDREAAWCSPLVGWLSRCGVGIRSARDGLDYGCGASPYQAAGWGEGLPASVRKLPRAIGRFIPSGTRQLLRRSFPSRQRLWRPVGGRSSATGSPGRRSPRCGTRSEVLAQCPGAVRS